MKLPRGLLRGKDTERGRNEEPRTQAPTTKQGRLLGKICRVPLEECVPLQSPMAAKELSAYHISYMVCA